MPRLLALVAAAAAIALAAAAASAQTAPGTPGALIYGLNGSVTVDGTATNGAAIVATDANGATFNAAWDTVGWSVSVTPNSEISFTVNGVPVADTVNSGRAGSAIRGGITLVAVTPEPEPEAENGDLLGDDGDDAGDGSMMGGDDGDADGSDDLLGDDGDEGDLLGDEDDGSMMGDGDDSSMSDGDSGSMMGDGGNGDADGSMSQLPVGGTGGLLGAGSGTDAWVFGLSGALVLLGLAGAFAAHRKTTAHTA